MVNYACGFNQPETEKYFELIKKRMKMIGLRNMNSGLKKYMIEHFDSERLLV